MCKHARFNKYFRVQRVLEMLKLAMVEFNEFLRSKEVYMSAYKVLG